MTEPVRVNELMQSGLALNAGRLLEQYSGLTHDLSPAYKYEGTLALSVLQMLLTNCTALYDAFSDESPGEELARNINEFNRRLVQPDFVVLSLFPGEGEVTGMLLLPHLRHAVSHPRAKAVAAPTTGYETVQDGSDLVSRFRFTHSPDVDHDGESTKKRKDGGQPEPRVFTVELSLMLLTALAHHVAMVLGKPALEREGQYSELVPAVPSADV